MRFLVICDDAANMPWGIPVDGSAETALSAAAGEYEPNGLVRPLMVVDYEESIAWRVGQDEGGWFLSDTVTTKMGLLTEPTDIPRELERAEVKAFVDYDDEEEQTEDGD